MKAIMTHGVSHTNKRRLANGFIIAIVICLGLITAFLYAKSIPQNSTNSASTKTSWYSAKSFAATYTVNRTYTSKNNVVINNLWRMTHKIVGGLSHSCALSNGKVYCWGRNNAGQLGDNTTTNRLTPVAVYVGTSGSPGALYGKYVTDISAGGGHTCAIAGSRAYCWGGNGSGRLGNGPNNGVGGVNSSTTDQPAPVAVTTTSGAMLAKQVTAISAGGYHTCAIADNQGYCWGRSGEGQIGNSTPANPNQGQPASDAYSQTTPAAINGGSSSLTSISAGTGHTCAVASGIAYCWGGFSNTCGGVVIGNNTAGCSTNVNTPNPVNTASGLANKIVTSITAGASQSCAIANGAAYCWGSNLAGELGTGNASASLVPAVVSTSGSSALPASAIVTNIAAGVYTDASQYQTCAVADGKAYCWGSNTYGQLGNGNTGTNTNYPVAVASGGVFSGKYISLVTPGTPFACAVANGRAYCWGRNDYGQLGNNSTTDTNYPVRVNDSYY